jgi:hypothetical protein
VYWTKSWRASASPLRRICPQRGCGCPLFL